QAFDANPGDLAPIRSLMNMYAEAGRLLGALAAAGLARDLPQPDEAKVALDVAMLHLTRLLLQEFPAPARVGEADEVVAALLASSARRPARVRLSIAR